MKAKKSRRQRYGGVASQHRRKSNGIATKCWRGIGSGAAKAAGWQWRICERRSMAARNNNNINRNGRIISYCRKMASAEAARQ